MATSEAVRKASREWQKKNYKRLGVKLYKEDAEAFENYCKENGLSVNAALRECVAERIGRPLTIRGEAAGEESGEE